MDVIQTLGKYEIRGTLGKGAMGTVYDGWDPAIARRVAIKTVSLPTDPDPDTLEEIARFRREAQAAGRLTHPNIVAVYDYGETADMAYIVMEFVDGPSLKAPLDAHERFPLATIQRVMGDLLAGLQFSHDRGVVHRDIKPANIMMTLAGQAKIADFGIARIEMSSMTQAGTMLGTPSYMSPEQFRGEVVDARTDVYSSGVVLYQLLTGERPFEGGLTAIMHKVLTTEPPVPSQLSGTAPTSLDAVVKQAIAKRPDDRYPSAAAFAEAIRAALAAPPAPPPALNDSEATLVGATLLRGPDPFGAADFGLSAATPAAAGYAAPGPAMAAAATPRPAAPPSARAVPPGTPAPGRSRMPMLIGLSVVVILVLGAGSWFLFGPSQRATVPQAPGQLAAADQQPAPVSGIAPTATPSGAGAQSPPIQSPPIQPTAGQTTSGQTTARATTSGQPTAGQPMAGQTTAAQTTLGQPAAGQTAAGQTTSGQTTSGQPTAGQTTAGQTAAGQSTAGHPAAGQSIAGQPTAGHPSMGQPVVSQQVAPAQQAPPSQQLPGQQPAATTGVTPPAPAASETNPPSPPVQEASTDLRGVRQQLAQVTAQAPCSLASSLLQDSGAVSVFGYAGGDAAAALRQRLMSIVAAAPLDWRIQQVDPVFCTALATLRPIAAQAGAPVSGLSVTLAGGQTTLHDGERIMPRVTMPDFAGELRVDYLGHDGSLVHLYPTAADPAQGVAARPATRLAPGAQLSIGEAGPGRPIWEVGPPYGTDMIIVVASSAPVLTRAPSQNADDNAAPYLHDLANGIARIRQAGGHVAGTLLLVETLPK